MKKFLIVTAAILLFAAANTAVVADRVTDLNDSINLDQNYTLYLASVDGKSRTAEFHLIYDLHVLDKKVVSEGDSIALFHGGDIIVAAKFDQLWVGSGGYSVEINNLYQFDRDTGRNILYTERVMLQKPYIDPFLELYS